MTSRDLRAAISFSSAIMVKRKFWSVLLSWLFLCLALAARMSLTMNVYS